MTKTQTMLLLCCPVCKTERHVDLDEFNLIVQCGQFMCWETCGMDIWVENLKHIFPETEVEE